MMILGCIFYVFFVVFVDTVHAFCAFLCHGHMDAGLKYHGLSELTAGTSEMREWTSGTLNDLVTCSWVTTDNISLKKG